MQDKGKTAEPWVWVDGLAVMTPSARLLSWRGALTVAMQLARQSILLYGYSCLGYESGPPKMRLVQHTS